MVVMTGRNPTEISLILQSYNASLPSADVSLYTDISNESSTVQNKPDRSPAHAQASTHRIAPELSPCVLQGAYEPDQAV